CERHPGDWFAHPTGIEFLAESATFLARVGDAKLAEDYLRRAESRTQEIGHPEIAWGARGAIEARFGDPAAAEEVLNLYADSTQQPPREIWRTLLLRANAARRRGDHGGAAELAARAFAAAENLGYPELPYIQEADLAASLAHAVAASSPPLAASLERAPQYAIVVLGSFSVTADGRPVAVPPGKPSLLVKRLAL